MDRNILKLIRELGRFKRITNEKEMDDVELEKILKLMAVVYEAINSAISAIIITDNDGVISYTNDAFLKMFEYESNEELLNKNASDLFYSEDIKQISDVKHAIGKTKGTIEVEVYRKNKGTFWVEASYSDVVDNDGEIMGRMASFIDISDKKQIEEDNEKIRFQLHTTINALKKFPKNIKVCNSCYKILDDNGEWVVVETYFNNHSYAGVVLEECPVCRK